MASGDAGLAWHSFAAAKAGHVQEEYEDAFAGSADAGRFAVADGASEASYAGSWATALVQHFLKTRGPWSRWLPAARQSWLEGIQDRERPWYAEEKFQQGAYATFLGVFFSGHAFASWTAAAVGDCCLFQVRNQSLLRAFPVRRACEFDNQPGLLGSRKPAQRIKRLHYRGDWQQNDRLFLMTDALAQWFLEQVESRLEPWHALLATTTQEAFEEWIAALRHSALLRNDDVTLAVIQGGRGPGVGLSGASEYLSPGHP